MSRGYIYWLSIALSLVAVDVLAEGSYQTGLNQPLLEEEDASGYPQFVDILSIGEVINVSICGEADTDDVRVEILDPDGISVLDTTLTDGNVSCADPFTVPLTNPLRHTTTKSGAYEVHLDNVTNVEIDRFDITVTPDAVTNPDPTVSGGRVWAQQWGFYTHTFDEANATDADYFPLIPGGRANTNYVWKLDLNKFSGNKYVLSANDLGVDAPNSGYSVSTTGNSITPKFPIYLSYPSIAQARPIEPPVIMSFRFVDDAGQDYGISPGSSVAVQDSGTFEFESDVEGTFSITIDTNKDGIYGAGDKLILGNAVVGTNQFTWDGSDATGATLGVGTYSAQLQLRMGEYHFIADDAETSGGGVAAADGIGEGLTIYMANSDGSTLDTNVYWDDQTFLAASSNLPNGAQSSTAAGKHTWGDFTGGGIGDKTYIDTYVYGLASTAKGLLAIAADDTGLSGVDGVVSALPSVAVAGNTVNVTVTDADLNILGAIQETIIVSVSNGRTGEIEQITLTEAGVSADSFGGPLNTADNAAVGTDNDGSMNVQNGDVLTITYLDQLDVSGNSVNRTAPITFADADGDGIADDVDLDDDNDGIPDVDEGNGVVDTDGDGIVDSLDLDSDNDGLQDHHESGLNHSVLDTNNDGQIDAANGVGSNGLADVAETAADSGSINYTIRETDGDTVLDFRDLDSDNDGIPDVTESGGADPDGNGRVGAGIPAVDANGIPSSGALTEQDRDGDGSANHLDLDSDADGVADLVEAGGTDGNGDGRVDGFTDLDGNGLDDVFDTTQAGAPLPLTDSASNGTPDYLDNADNDGDGIPDSVDLDDDNDGITDVDEGNGSVDTDGDGVADSRDLDSDNDGLFDLVESGSSASGLDTNNDGRIDVVNPVGSNGLADVVETGVDSGAVNYTLRETDGDVILDFRDLDSDNDGISDVVEAGGSDADEDGVLGTGAPVVDVDGIPASGGLIAPDLDGDGVVNPLDLDSDGDGLHDLVEAGAPDVDADGRLDGFSDGDANGFHDSVEATPLPLPDTDSDGVPNYLDLDSDNDGIFDVIESTGQDPDLDGRAQSSPQTVDGNGVLQSGALTPVDTDADGVNDYLDLDSDNDSIPDVIETGGVDPDGDGIIGNGAPAVDSDGVPAGGGLQPVDTDSDGAPDQRDLDSDGDTLSDLKEAGGTDTDNDSLVDGFTDADGDGFDDTSSGTPMNLPDADGDSLPDYRDIDDADNDGIGDAIDIDDDNDGIPDVLEGDGAVDTDGDGVPDSRDLDSDNDGLLDVQESGADAAALDTNSDGRIDATNSFGSNGLADAVETSTDSGALTYNGGVPLETDGDGIANFRDLDSDNDGVYDVAEAGGIDQDGDGLLGAGVPVVNLDGLAAASGLPAPDADDDGVPNHLDLDSDNDGLPDVIEAGGSDPDSDGIVGAGVPSVDVTGVPQASPGTDSLSLPDTDGDGMIDMLDLDSDGDGMSDLAEAGGTDVDGDGQVDDFVDLNGDGVDDNMLAAPLPMPDTDGDGIPDYQETDVRLLQTGINGVGGCSVGNGSANDPTLPLLLLISAIYLLRRRQLAPAKGGRR